MKILSTRNEVYKFAKSEKLISDGVTFFAFILTNNNLGIDEIASRTKSIIESFYSQDFTKYKNNYCICHQCKNGILINYQLDENFSNKIEYQKFLNEIKSLSKIQNQFSDSIKQYKKLYLVYYSPTSIRCFEYNKNIWNQVAIKSGYDIGF